jgi:hypothetical protein
MRLIDSIGDVSEDGARGRSSDRFHLGWAVQIWSQIAVAASSSESTLANNSYVDYFKRDRRNCPFARTGSGGERAGAVSSLIGTVKINGIVPKRICAECLNASPAMLSTASTNSPGGRREALRSAV